MEQEQWTDETNTDIKSMLRVKPHLSEITASIRLYGLSNYNHKQVETDCKRPYGGHRLSHGDSRPNGSLRKTSWDQHSQDWRRRKRRKGPGKLIRGLPNFFQQRESWAFRLFLPKFPFPLHPPSGPPSSYISYNNLGEKSHVEENMKTGSSPIEKSGDYKLNRDHSPLKNTSRLCYRYGRCIQINPMIQLSIWGGEEHQIS